MSLYEGLDIEIGSIQELASKSSAEKKDEHNPEANVGVKKPKLEGTLQKFV